MIIYPAIDMKDGQCVRLVRGAMDQATVFSDSPADQALHFQRQGFSWLHVVDLNGAVEGRSVNSLAISDILNQVSVPVQLGGGIRTMQQIDDWITSGITRVILGTKAAHEPEFVREACRTFPGHIAVGIDAKAGKVAVDGWVKVSDIDASELALRFEDAGVSAIIYTDIARDGVMQGPNLDETVRLAQRLSTPVILSGGVSSMADVAAVKAQEAAGIDGMIIGRAMYEGAIDPAQALKIVRAPC